MAAGPKPGFESSRLPQANDLPGIEPAPPSPALPSPEPPSSPQPGAAPPSIPGLLQQAVALHRQGRFADAEALYRQIIQRDPAHFDALHLCGVAALQTRRVAHGIDLIRQAIAVNPGLAEAHANLANGLREQRRYQDALASFDRALALRPDQAETHRDRAITLQHLGRYPEALASYRQALALQPDLEALAGMAAHAHMAACDWTGAPHLVASLIEAVARGDRPEMPFALVALTESPALQRQAAETYVRARCPADPALPAIAPRPPRDRLHIGYFSADFHNHATAYLMAETFERHDRTAFEVTAFSFGGAADGDMRQRLMRAFDRFVDVHDRADRDVALMARSLGVDIAVDLKGFTQGFRTGIFAARAAPIQVNYLGYPGTMGAPYVDYIIADPVVVPETDHAHYAEKVVVLPDCYQPNDTQRHIAVTPTRAEAGLPPDGFVFCCFNNSYKITPAVFETWLRLLHCVAGSVLWLLHDNDAAVANLRAVAQRQGIAPHRLVFAPRLDLPQHLARHRLADLFLDTLPYNAHTTASDALWAGLPVLTRIGTTFAGRVAASLLTAIDLPELITATPQAYEAKAVALATNPAALAALKARLARHRATAPLFDSALFTRHLEAAFQAMVARYQAGLPPAHIRVPRMGAPAAEHAPPRPEDRAPRPEEPAPGPEDAAPPPAWQQVFQRAVALHRQGEVAAAAQLYEDVLRQYPDCFDGLHLRGIAALQMRRTAEGIDWVRKAIALHPAVAEAHNTLGNALREQGRYAEALACFDRALELRPNYDEAQRNRAATLQRLTH